MLPSNNSSNPRVAIIVPVYNVEAYIAECLKSLKNQTYEDITFIIVNDGTKDNSANIIKSTIKSDGRFVLLEQENKGLCSARNLGIEYICNHPELKIEYISFVDSDDYISLDYAERLATALTTSNADCALCAYHPFTKHKTQTKFKQLFARTMTSEEYAAHYFQIDENLNPVPADPFTSLFLNNRMFRWTTVSHLRFNERLRACEDQDYNIRSLPTIKSATLVPFYGFFYRKRASSLSNDSTVKSQDLLAYECLFSDKTQFSQLIQRGIERNYIKQMFQFTMSNIANFGNTHQRKDLLEDITRRIEKINISNLDKITQKKQQFLPETD